MLQQDNAQGAWKGISLALTIIVVLVLSNYNFSQSDWIPHTREVVVYFKASEWVTGEFVDCYSFTGETQEVASLVCGFDRNNPHTIRVKFWGSITNERDKTWKCERGANSLTCKLQ